MQSAATRPWPGLGACRTQSLKARLGCAASTGQVQLLDTSLALEYQVAAQEHYRDSRFPEVSFEAYRLIT